jgi:solute carrier family 35, member F1/2
MNFILRYLLQTKEQSWCCSPFILVFGQTLALLLACGNATQASLSARCNVSVPTISVGLVYACLSLCLIPLYYESKNQTLKDQEEQFHEEVALTNHEQQELVKKRKTTDDVQKQNSILQADVETMRNTNENIEVANISNEQSEIYSKISTSRRISHCRSIANDSVVHDNDDTRRIADLQQKVLRQSSEPKKIYRFLFGHLRLAVPYYNYIIVALLDFYANYCTVLAFKYTTITSVTLLDALAIPSAMILSRILLKRQYTKYHFVGICLCIFGILVNVLLDVHQPDAANDGIIKSNEDEDKNATITFDLGSSSMFNDDNTKSDHDQLINGYPETQYPHKLYGDLLAISGGTLLGAVNVIGEMVVRDYGGPNEYIGMLGLWAVCVCVLHGLLWERDEIAQFISIVTSLFNGSTEKFGQCYPAETLLLILAFVFVASSIYLGVARFLLYSESAFLNLNLLTADMWSILFSVVSLHTLPQEFFYVALSTTMIGVVIYEMAPSPIVDDICQYHSATHDIAEDDVDTDVDGIITLERCASR